MKKILYGTTALVTAGVLASSGAQAQEGIELGLGGYMNNFFSFGEVDEADNETADFNNTGFFSDGEIHFEGETTLDNGLTFGAQVQLEAFQSDPDQVDENFAYVEGAFGRINLGSENSAAYLMQYSAPNVGVPVNSGWVTSFIPPAPNSVTAFRTPAVGTYLDYGNDENSITYFTPRFAGFQVGVSYAPAVVGTGEGKNFPVQADTETEFYDGVSVGANYVAEFDVFDIAVAGGYRRATAPDTPGTGGNEPLNDDDLNQYSAGANIGFAGFTVGGSYALEDSGRASDGDAWDAGVSYSIGPWSVGALYFESAVDGFTGLGDSDLTAIQGAVGYSVGPGIDTSFSVLWGEWDQDIGGTQDGIQGILGLAFTF
jgi:outer membrane protein OmpU